VKNGSQIRAIFSGEMPVPVSLTGPFRLPDGHALADERAGKLGNQVIVHDTRRLEQQRIDHSRRVQTKLAPDLGREVNRRARRDFRPRKQRDEIASHGIVGDDHAGRAALPDFTRGRPLGRAIDHDRHELRARHAPGETLPVLDAILENRDRRAAPAQRPEPLCGAGSIVSLGRDEHPINRLRLRRVGEDRRRKRHELRSQVHAKFGNRTTRTKHDLVARDLAQAGRDHAAHRPRTDDRDSRHAPIPGLRSAHRYSAGTASSGRIVMSR
jgi:hypothetical protein